MNVLLISKSTIYSRVEFIELHLAYFYIQNGIEFVVDLINYQNTDLLACL